MVALGSGAECAGRDVSKQGGGGGGVGVWGVGSEVQCGLVLLAVVFVGVHEWCWCGWVVCDWACSRVLV